MLSEDLVTLLPRCVAKLARLRALPQSVLPLAGLAQGHLDRPLRQGARRGADEDTGVPSVALAGVRPRR